MINIIIYGTGTLSKFLMQNINLQEVNVIAYADSFNCNDKIDNIPVINEEDINKYKFDYIVIAFSNVKAGMEKLEKLNVDKSKVVAYSASNDKSFMNSINNYCNNKMHSYLNDYDINKIFKLEQKNLYQCSMDTYKDYREIIEDDYVREQTLALLSEEIKRKKLKGDVAELGVYKGEFSKKINSLFDDRNLYLFDTFEGFDIRDVQQDNTVLCKNTELKKWKNTNVDFVLQQMPHREKCIIKKGYFPDSFDLFSTNFVFVSIDVNLYTPIFNGLDIFYPKLVSGGYIMVHDYNSKGYEGTKKAVIDYCAKNNISYVPLCDKCGSIVITK